MNKKFIKNLNIIFITILYKKLIIFFKYYVVGQVFFSITSARYYNIKIY